MHEPEVENIDSFPDWEYDPEDVEQELQQNGYGTHTPTEIASSIGNTNPWVDQDLLPDSLEETIPSEDFDPKQHGMTN